MGKYSIGFFGGKILVITPKTRNQREKVINSSIHQSISHGRLITVLQIRHWYRQLKRSFN